MTKIVRLEPHSMAVFFSIDTDPGFAMKLCNDVSLFTTVHGGMFMKEQDAESRAEVADIVEKLRRGGDVAFEDGWISLRVGMADVASFLMQKTIETKQEERWADKQRFDEMKMKQVAEARHALLRQALVEALGDGAAALAALAVA